MNFWLSQKLPRQVEIQQCLSCELNTLNDIFLKVTEASNKLIWDLNKENTIRLLFTEIVGRLVNSSCSVTSFDTI